MIIEHGWDSVAEVVDGRWLDRRPRRPAVAERLRGECRLMPWLAPQLPVAVPVPRVLREDPLVVRHALVPGDPITEPRADHGRTLGAFLRALHAVPAREAVRRGLRPGDVGETVARFRADVLPLLDRSHRGSAAELLDAVAATRADTVVHGDLGPEHVLVVGDGVSGVIDFTDACLGDAALDLTWPLYGAPLGFARAVAAAYGPTDAQRERALLWHRLVPWHAVDHGLRIGDQDAVRAGLAEVVRRLAGG